MGTPFRTGKVVFYLREDFPIDWVFVGRLNRMGLYAYSDYRLGIKVRGQKSRQVIGRILSNIVNSM